MPHLADAAIALAVLAATAATTFTGHPAATADGGSRVAAIACAAIACGALTGPAAPARSRRPGGQRASPRRRSSSDGTSAATQAAC